MSSRSQPEKNTMEHVFANFQTLRLSLWLGDPKLVYVWKILTAWVWCCWIMWVYLFKVIINNVCL